MPMGNGCKFVTRKTIFSSDAKIRRADLCNLDLYENLHLPISPTHYNHQSLHKTAVCCNCHPCNQQHCVESGMDPPMHTTSR